VQNSTQKVPFLGDIPFLGRLFRSDSEQVIKTNLLIFIRATIIRDNEQLDGATADKYRYIRKEQQRRIEQGLMYLDDENIPLLPAWEDQIKQLEEIKRESGAATTDEL
jgi:general secretion pathway protein D